MTGFETLSCMPERVTSGDTVTIALAALSQAYPVGDYTLQVAIKLGAGMSIVVDLANTGGLHGGTLNFAGAIAGTWSYAIKATWIADGTARTVQAGTVLVMPDAATQDTRSHAEKVLDALEALIEGRASKDVNSYSIAGRSLTRMSPAELIEWRDRYRREVAVQRAAGLPNRGRKITLARFH